MNNPVLFIDPDGMRVSLFDNMAGQIGMSDEGRQAMTGEYRSEEEKSGSTKDDSSTSDDCCGGQTAMGYLGEGLRQYMQEWGKFFDRFSFSSYTKTKTEVLSHSGIGKGTIENELSFGIRTSFFNLFDNSLGNNRPGKWTGQFGLKFSSVFKATHQFSASYGMLDIKYKHQAISSDRYMKISNEYFVGRGSSGLFYNFSSTNGAAWSNNIGAKVEFSSLPIFRTTFAVGAKVQVNID